MIDRLIVLIGPPGAGKGMLANWLARTYGFQHLSVGWILQNALQDQALQNQLEPVWKSGQLVDDQTITQIVSQTLTQQTKPTVILDGYPRNLHQHELLLQIVADHNLPQPIVIILDLPLPIAQQRVAERLVCQQCQAVYHRKFWPSQVPNRCDYDQSTLVARADQHQTQRRFNVYQTQTVPLVQWYYQHQSRMFNTILRLNGNQTPVAIQKLVQKFFQLPQNHNGVN